MLRPRQTPIFDSGENFVGDFAGEMNEASRRRDFQNAQHSREVDRRIAIEQDNRRIKRNAINSAMESVAQVQGKAAPMHQSYIDKKITEARDWLATTDLDPTSLEYKNEMGRRIGEIASFNNASSGLIKNLAKWEEKAKRPEYNTQRLIPLLRDMAYNPQSIDDLSSIDQRVQDLFDGNMDVNVALKDYLEKNFGAREVARSRTRGDGSLFEENYTLENLFGFNGQGAVSADRSQIDLDYLREFYPQVIRWAENEVNQLDQSIISNSSKSFDELMKDEIGSKLESLSTSRLSTRRKDPNTLDIAQDQQRLRNLELEEEKKKKELAGKPVLEWEQNYNDFVEGILNQDIAKSSKVVPGQKVEVITKKDYLSRLKNQIIRRYGTEDEMTEEQIKAANKAVEAMDDNDILSVRVAGQNFPVTLDGLKSAWNFGAGKAFSNRDDKADFTNTDFQLNETVLPILDEISTRGQFAPGNFKIIKEVMGEVNSKEPEQSPDNSGPQEVTIDEIKATYGENWEEALEALRQNDSYKIVE